MIIEESIILKMHGTKPMRVSHGLFIINGSRRSSETEVVKSLGLNIPVLA